MKIFTLIIFVIVSLAAYSLGKRDGHKEFQLDQFELTEAMSSIDITKYSNTEEIKKAVAEKLGVDPDDIFIEKVEISKNENRKDV